MNIDIDDTVMHYAMCLDYQHIQLHEKTILHEFLSKPSKMVGADTFSINNETLLNVVDYHSKFPIMKRPNGLSTGDLIRAAKMCFQI